MLYSRDGIFGFTNMPATSVSRVLNISLWLLVRHKIDDSLKHLSEIL